MTENMSLPIFDDMKLPPVLPLRTDAQKRLEEIRNLQTGDKDVLLIAYPKSGTHWVWEITNMLLSGNAEYMESNKVSQFLEAIPDLNNISEKQASPRVLNTHLPFRWLPKNHIQNGNKIVHVIRNPKDIMVSLYFHLLSGPAPSQPKTDLSGFVEQEMKESEKWYGGWFVYEKEFEKAEEEGTTVSIYTIQYENLKRNTLDEVRKLASYLQVDAPESLIEDIADKCGFQNLKYAMKILNKDNKMADGAVKNPLRKGIIGDWKNHFTADQNKWFDKLYYLEMKDSKIEVQFE